MYHKKAFFHNFTPGIVYVVDAADVAAEALDESKQELKSIIEDPKMLNENLVVMIL